MSDIQIVKAQIPSDETLKILASLELQIFEKALTKEAIAAELAAKLNLIVLFALDGTKQCAFKIGYEHSPDTYYSWSGGVLPDYRARGIARALMNEQHRLARDLGYKYVRTHTKNRYRQMLILNIRCGFDVIGVYKKLSESEPGIILEKALN